MLCSCSNNCTKACVSLHYLPTYKRVIACSRCISIHRHVPEGANIDPTVTVGYTTLSLQYILMKIPNTLEMTCQICKYDRLKKLEMMDQNFLNR